LSKKSQYEDRLDGTNELLLTGTHYIIPYRLKDQKIQILSIFMLKKGA